jgi:sugar O-acyltransferase (sialic acid O-acetyltransferase NeuD family)
MSRIVIFGAGAFAELAHYYFTHDSAYTVAAFTVDGAYLREPTFRGLPVVPYEEVPARFPPEEYGMFVAIGIGRVNRLRAAKVDEVETSGYRLASFVSSRADVAADLEVRPNTMIMERAGIQPFVAIGRDTIVWSASRIGFHTRVGDHCWLTCALFGESVTIGDFTFVGLNATVAPGLTLGRSNVIGAGALILHDTKDDEVYPGTPSVASRVPSHRLRRFRS